MIDPNNVTNPARTAAELGEFLLFCVVVAGKNADQQSLKLERFLGGRRPFAFIRASDRDGTLDGRLRDVRLGKYSLLGRSFRELARSGADLGSCGWEALTRFPGIGIKTAKFFILHSRAREMHGVLDTHVLGPAPRGGTPPFPAGPGPLPLLGNRVLRDGDGPAPPGRPWRGRRLGALRPRTLEGAARRRPRPPGLTSRAG